ncbi:MAG: kelch repeat-containing protein [Maricaulaceae bacterium]
MDYAKLDRRTVLTGMAAFAFAGCSKAITAQDNDTAVAQKKIRGWSISPSFPEAVQEIYPCAHKGRIHLAGGFTAQSGMITGPTAAHHVWAPGTSAWERALDLPVARHHPHLISFNDQLLAFAGFESTVDTPFAQGAWTIQQTGWALSADGMNWLDMPEMPAPAAEAVVGVTGDNVLHLAGGRTWQTAGTTGGWRDHIDTDHHFVLSDLDGPWEQAAPCLYKRNSAAGAVIDGHLHNVGGRQVGGGNVAYHTVYDHKEDRWHTLAPMPQAQGGLAAAAIDGELYAFGGEFFDNGGGVYPQGWVYDPARDGWATLPVMPNPRHGLGAVALGADIYVIGGALKASGIETSALVERFTP